MIITGDVHLQEVTEETVFGEVFPDLLALAKEGVSEDLVFLGDLMHIRYNIAARLFDELHETIRELANHIRVHILVGNHDQYNVLGGTALSVFDHMHNVRVYDEPEVTDIGYFLPYREAKQHVAADIETLRNGKQQPKRPFMFMHHGIQGAIVREGLFDTTGIDPTELLAPVTFCGHYHKQQVWNTNSGEIVYVGSPYQTKADEAGQDKGLVYVDSENVWHFWKKDYGPKFYHVAITEEQQQLPAHIKQRDIVTVTVAKGLDTEAVAKSMSESGYNHLRIAPQQDEQQLRLSVDSHDNIDAYAQAYVDHVSPQHEALEANRLMKIWREFVGGLR
jgi:DNA repair exonuclease SbcCD nuclease subunit